MRIKLKKGKQKELIVSFKTKKQFTWKKFSEFLGISESSLVEYSREKNLLSIEIYNKLDPDKKSQKYVLEIKDELWGRRKGGFNSRGSLKDIIIPEKNKELAEFIGILLGDGNIYASKKFGSYSIRIAGDLIKDRQYHIEYVVPLCENLFWVNAKIQLVPKQNEIFVCLYGKQITDFLNELGLKSGDKIKNQVSIPKWIFDDLACLSACVRGLIDTDGSIFRMSQKDPNLIRINFTNYNATLLQDTRNAFIRLGFHPSKIINGRQFFISRQKEVIKYINEVGFSNNKHLKRIKNFYSPVV